MRLPLSDPIWSRLPGAYGVQHVNTILAKLSTQWDSALAKDLFWEKLHHQGTLYPVTFAALPWIMHIWTPEDDPDVETLFFVSHVVFLAAPFEFDESSDLRPELQKVSFRVPEAEELPATDQPALRALAAWFTENATSLSEICLAAAPGRTDREAAALAVSGCTVRGQFGAANALYMLAGGHALYEITDGFEEYGSLTDGDISALLDLAVLLDPSHPKLCDDILFLTGRDLPDPNQLELPL